jgi:rubredoxin
MGEWMVRENSLTPDFDSPVDLGTTWMQAEGCFRCPHCPIFRVNFNMLGEQFMHI